MNTYILKFEKIGLEDLPKVGGKNSSLFEMYSYLRLMLIVILYLLIIY